MYNVSICWKTELDFAKGTAATEEASEDEGGEEEDLADKGEAEVEEKNKSDEMLREKTGGLADVGEGDEEEGGSASGEGSDYSDNEGSGSGSMTTKSLSGEADSRQELQDGYSSLRLKSKSSKGKKSMLRILIWMTV